MEGACPSAEGKSARNVLAVVDDFADLPDCWQGYEGADCFILSTGRREILRKRQRIPLASRLWINGSAWAERWCSPLVKTLRHRSAQNRPFRGLCLDDMTDRRISMRIKSGDWKHWPTDKIRFPRPSRAKRST